jgi:hypothetical protein
MSGDDRKGLANEALELQEDLELVFSGVYLEEPPGEAPDVKAT